MRSLALACAILLLPAAPSAQAAPMDKGAAPADEGAAPACAKCKDTGQVPCEKHAQLNVGDLKVGDFFCADCLDLDCCHGLGWNVCSKCKDAAAGARWKDAFASRKTSLANAAKTVEERWLPAKKLQSVRERQARQKPPEKDGKGEQAVPRVFLNVLYTPQAFLATDMAGRRLKLTPKGALQVLDAHQVQHLYLGRIMEVFRDVQDLHRPGAFDADRKGMGELPAEIPALAAFHYTVCIFARGDAHAALTATVFEQETQGPLSSPTLLSCWENPVIFGQDADLHRYVYACVAGGVIHQYNEDPRRTQEDKKKDEHMPTWLSQGFGHLLELRRWGLCEESGVQETRKVDSKKGSEGWKADHWPKAVSERLAKGKARPFPELSKMVLDDMQCSDHQVSWSYVDFLLRQGMDKLAKLTPLLRKPGSDQAAALREAYGLTQAELEDRWKAFVKAGFK